MGRRRGTGGCCYRPSGESPDDGWAQCSINVFTANVSERSRPSRAEKVATEFAFVFCFAAHIRACALVQDM